MKIRSLLISLLIVIIFIGILGVGYYFFLSPKSSSDKTIKNISDKSFGWKFPVAKFPITGPSGKQIAYSNIRDPGGIPQGLPVRLKIPSIGVDSAIEDALITPDGRMDVPAGSVNVAWFSLGPHPGQVGSAVIGGHFGITKGVPFVFYNLDKLKSGAKVYILNDKGETLAFVVRTTKSFDRNGDSTTVFTSTDKLAHLNLITCEGIWNQVNGTYPSRLVIFTDAIPSEGAVVVAKPKTVIKPTLPKTALETAQPTINPTSEPSASPQVIAIPKTENNAFGTQIISESVKSLYGTPADGVVTTVLLISIALIGFKIISR